jgi:hypothetical protein
VNRALAFVFAVTIVAFSAAGQPAPKWRVFVSRAGWSINYPSDWRLGSCNSCKDLRKPGIYVDFFSPEPLESMVMVEPLADRPSDASADSWLIQVAKTANLNPHLQEQRLLLDDQPALRVRYRTSSGQQMEAVYVVFGSKTFEIEFNGDLSEHGSVDPLETLGNYQTYLKMLATFKMRNR